MKVWYANQLRQFLQDIVGHRLYPAFYLLANTGMRTGEAPGLRWDDVDLAPAALPVSRALVDVAHRPQLSDLKTSQGRRTIDLDAKTVAVLRTWRGRQTGRAVCSRTLRPDTDLIFPHPDGSCIHPDYLSQVFDRHVVKSTLRA
jgi:integrase